MSSDLRTADGAFDFSLGVDSGKVPTIESALTPNGLKRNQLAWAKNATMRGGSISPRAGWKKLCRAAAPGSGLYQGGFPYDASALDPALNPYLILSIGGNVLQVRVDTDNSVVDLSAASGLTNPAAITQSYFCQGEEFLVIQAGDDLTLPLFWDGGSLRRSNGISTSTALPEFAGVSFVVPAIGACVKVTLTAPYSGLTNQDVTIDGYTYRQVLVDQRYTFYGGTTMLGQPPNTFFLPATTECYWSGLSGSLLADVDSNNGAVVAGHWEMTAYIGDPFNGTGLQVMPYVTNGPPVKGAVTGWNCVHNNLGALGANEIWLINIDDPRAGDTVTFPSKSLNELPAAGPMDYYMGRIWYAQGRTYCAGDIVGGDNGTGAYKFRDAILKVTENPLAVGGDGFTVPSNAGNITALSHPANIDSATGQGLLTIFTSKSVYQLAVPVTRTQWIAANDATQPKQTVVQKTNGSYAERSVVSHNGDEFYSSTDGIRSLITAVRYFGQWANIPISANEKRAMDFNDDDLMRYASGMVFDNRLWQTCLPVETDAGVAFQGIVPLDFDIISTLAEKLPPAWEGMYEGLQILQLFSANFQGRERAFAVTVSDVDGGIDVWELTKADKSDDAQLAEQELDRPIRWYFETPAFTEGKEFDLKKLDGGELWIDRVVGCVDVKVEYRPDGNPCWQPWHDEKLCSRRNTCEDPDNPVCYPATVDYQEGYRFPVALPVPPYPKGDTMNRRPVNIGFQFQVKVTITGFCRVRGLLIYLLPSERQPFENLR